MKTARPGEALTFRATYSNADGELVDPPEVTFTVYKTVTLPTYGPLRYSGGLGDVERISQGVYQVKISVNPNLMPGIYTAQWEALVYSSVDGGRVNIREVLQTIDGGTPGSEFDENLMGGFATTDFDGTVRFDRAEFQVLEHIPDRLGRLDAPRVHGIIQFVPNFNDMGLGLTSQLCIVGHCSGLTIGEPYQVEEISEAISLIGANQYSPMVRYLMEAYNAGCRDIWIMPAASESEFIAWDPLDPSQRLNPRPEFGGRNFYEQYYPSYVEAMQNLVGWDFPDIVVAPDAPFYGAGGIDFMTPMVESLVNGFVTTGRFRMGFMGDLIGTGVTDEDINAIVSDPRLDAYGEDGKTMCLVHGEATINLPNIGNAYSHSVANIAASTAAAMPFDQSLIYKPLPGIANPLGRDISKDQLTLLAQAKVNSITRTTRGRRGAAYNTVVATDNLLAANGSDFWALPQMRLVQEVIKNVRALSFKKIGTIEYRAYKEDVSRYIVGLIKSNRIRDARVTIERHETDPFTIVVNIVLKPFWGVREIYFSVEVGSGSNVVDSLFRNAP